MSSNTVVIKISNEKVLTIKKSIETFGKYHYKQIKIRFIFEFNPIKHA